MTQQNGKKNYTLLVVEENTKVFEQCGMHLKNGELVSFPTETVYGLGAHALNEEAVRKIFKAKGRPLSDPVIVHVLNWEDAVKKHDLVDVSQNEEIIVEHLSKNFWPGPLTLVVKASKKVPDCITASTGFVGIRSPSHPVARNLIDISGLPISAPSANRFGHISPTKAEHVIEDLGYTPYPIMIIKSSKKEHKCSVGIESSVLKISEENDKIQMTLFRRGGTSEEKLTEAIHELKLKYPKLVIDLHIPSKTVKNETKMGQQAPGQMITHYAPDIQTLMYSSDKIEVKEKNTNGISISECVFIDYNQHFFGKYSEKCKKYFLLSKSDDMKDVARHLFKTLRAAEKIEGAKYIIVPNLSTIDKEFAKACHDRLFRSASGRECLLVNETVYIKEDTTNITEN
mmetsp:Transcript_8220/g.12186  ORF Transcript_8220/g.12186 Transcript_8220/m.12186 type:complete len:399 (-) Transcript_8220:1891-3087(-)